MSSCSHVVRRACGRGEQITLDSQCGRNVSNIWPGPNRYDAPSLSIDCLAHLVEHGLGLCQTREWLVDQHERIL